MSRFRAWDASDEIGARNLVDRDATLRGVGCVSTGEVIPLALEIRAGVRGPAASMRMPVQHFMTRDGADYAAGLPEKHGFGYTDDVIVLPTHGTTHIDALSHVLCRGLIYNNHPASSITSHGAGRCGIEKVEPIVTRGIFVDLAPAGDEPQGYAITCDQLVRAVDETGVEPLPGDVLVVRTGWLEAWREGGAVSEITTGLHHDCAGWIAEKGFALVAADNIAVEVLPSRDPDCAAPLHIALTKENGVYLAELLDLERLAKAGRSTFQFMLSPLRIKGGVGSPVTPVAIL